MNRSPARYSRCTRVGATLVATLLGACTGSLDPSATPWGRLGEAITDGTLDTGHAAVGLLLIDASGGKAKSICTGTLVGSKTVLTATHCLEPGKPTLFKHAGQLYTVTKMIRRTDWDVTTSKYQNDIGLAILDRAVAGVPPLPLGKAPVAVGTKITLVGYGISAESATDAGKKRMATNTIAAMTPGYFTVTQTGSGVGNACRGDSGGPVFATVGGKEVIVGVISASVTPCGTKSYHVRVDAFASWLETQAAGDIGQGADTTPPKVTITAPQDGATVGPSVTLKVDATDDVGVVEVTAKVDGAIVATLKTPPYEPPLNLPSGPFAAASALISVEAKDAAGNVGSDTISVSIFHPQDSFDSGLGPRDSATHGTFGAPCVTPPDCGPGLVCRPLAAGATSKSCTQTCTIGFATCPEGSECVTIGQEQLCTKPKPQQPIVSGGCTISRGAASKGSRGAVPGGLDLFAILGLLAVLQRARRSQGR